MGVLLFRRVFACVAPAILVIVSKIVPSDSGRRDDRHALLSKHIGQC